MRRATATALVLLAAALVTALAVGACDGAGNSAGSESESDPQVDAPEGTLPYVFRLVGPTTADRTYYYAVGDAIDGPAAYRGSILGTRSTFVIEGRPGDAFHIRNEPHMTAAEVRMRWTLDVRGTLGPAEDAQGAKTIDIVAAERATIHVIAGPSKGGPDYVTLFHEESGTAACAVRDPNYGLVTAAWRGKSGNALREIAPPRPWTLSEFAPGPCIVAARTKGFQWMAVRADLSPGAKLDLDVGRQVKGGGTVICEDPNAVLVLAGQFPVPAPRLRTDLQYRSTWEGVPPGAHEVRYADGRIEKIDVSDGAETRLGK